MSIRIDIDDEGTTVSEVAFRILALADAGTRVAIDASGEIIQDEHLHEGIGGAQGLFEMISDLAGPLWNRLCDEERKAKEREAE